MAGLYVHIPFCSAKCAYCDFYSMPLKGRKTGEFIDALSRELDSRRGELTEPVKTIYIGGGTPSALPFEQLRRLFEILPTDEVEEFTVEVNPENVDAGLVSMLADSPANRVSMGVQSVVDSELRAVGRRHDARTALRAFELLRSGGIGNISLDLIFGLPGQTLSSWQQSLETLLALGPEHLSSYSLMLEAGTRLTAMVNRGKATVPSDETSDRMYGLLCRRLAEAGYQHYEISNFCLPGFHSRHNSAYWNHTPYVGLGPGAHSFDGHRLRRANMANLQRYLEDPTDCFTTETISAEQLSEEKIMLGLRTAGGLDLNDYRSACGDNAADVLLRKAHPLISDGRLQNAGNRLIIPEANWLISDRIIVELF